MRIKLATVFVDDQEKALKSYTEVLRFVKKTELPAGDFMWLTVVAEGRDDLKLLLEPNANPPAREYQKAIYAAGIPSTSVFVDGIEKDTRKWLSWRVVQNETDAVRCGESRHIRRHLGQSHTASRELLTQRARRQAQPSSPA